MKIGIVCGDCWTLNEKDAKRKIAYTWEEIEEYRKEGLKSCDYQTYIMIKLLEDNKHLEQFILETRKILGFKKKLFTVDEYLNEKYTDNKYMDSSSPESAQMWNNMDKIFRTRFYAHENVHRWFQTILFCEVIFPYHSIAANPITLSKGFSLDGTLLKSYFPINIEINKKITKKALIDFIEENWEKIKFDINSMQEDEIHEREYKIYSLKKSNKTHSEIADILAPEDDYDAKINEDSIKQAYYRITKKAASLFYPNK